MEHLVVQIYYNINFILKYSFYGGKKKNTKSKSNKIEVKDKLSIFFASTNNLCVVFAIEKRMRK